MKRWAAGGLIGMALLQGCGLLHPSEDQARQALVEALGTKASVLDFQKTGNAGWQEVGVFGNGTDWVSFQAKLRIELGYREWYRSQGRSLGAAEAAQQEGLVNHLLGGRDMAWAQASPGQEFGVEGRIVFRKTAEGWQGTPAD